MYTEGFEQWFKMNKNMTVPLNELNKVCMDIWQRTTQQNLEIIGNNFSLLSDQLKRFSNVRRPEEFFNLQKDLINETMITAMEDTQKIMNTTLENMEELSKLCGNTLNQTMNATMKTSGKEREKEGSHSK